MPLYAFEVVNKTTGEVVTHFDAKLPVLQRDELEVRRNGVPESLNIAGAAADPTNPNTQVLSTCKRMEQRMGTTELQRRLGGMPIETVKQAWSQPNS